jgi:pimeloyl-ACP methyl ester carboxylesterase
VTARRVRLASGLYLAVHEHGSGRPVVLVHAWGETHATFDRLVPLLEPHVHVIAPDQRGVGESDKPADGYSLSQAARDLVELLDALALPSAVLVGTSSGGYVVQQVVVDSPHRVCALVLAGSPADLSATGDPFGDALSSFHDPVTVEDVRAVNGSFSTHVRIPDDFFAAQDEAALTIPRHVWRGVYRGLFKARAPLAAGPVQVPALVLWGADDDLLPPSQADALVAGLPQGRVIRYPNTGHLVLWERPERVAADVLAFVTGSRHGLA